MFQPPGQMISDLGERGKQFAKRQVRKALRKLAVRLMKKVGQVIVKIFLKLLIKVFLFILGLIGIPGLLFLLAVVIISGVIMIVASAFSWITDDSPMSREEIEHQYEVSIEQSSPIDEFKPPFELVVAIDSIRIIKNDLNPWDIKPKPIVEGLSPNIFYETFTDEYKIKTVTRWTERVPKECDKGDLSDRESNEGEKDNNSKAGLNEKNEDCGYKYEPRSSTSYSTSTKNKELVKEVHAWNEDVTYYYKKVPLNDDYEKISQRTTSDGKEVTVYRKKTHEWQLATINRIPNYEKLDKVLLENNFQNEDVALLVESLKANNIFMDGYVGNYLDAFIDAEMTMVIPYEYMSIYGEIEEDMDIEWYLIAAIHYVENSFRDDLKADEVLGVNSRPYAYDGDSNERYEPNGDPIDALYTIANYIHQHGYSRTDKLNSALKTFNDQPDYIDKVITYAEKFRNTAGTVPAASRGAFMRPAVGPISSGFGLRWGKLHAGVDIARTKPIVPIAAAADGQVTRSYYSSTYGEVIFIEHNINGQVYETVYAHLKRGSRRVFEGDYVTKGQIIGLMGNTGQSTGPHLHFEVHKGPGWVYSKRYAIDPIRSGLIEW